LSLVYSNATDALIFGLLVNARLFVLARAGDFQGIFRMSEEGNNPAPAGGENGTGETKAAALTVVAQFIKDLSFENPMGPAKANIRPQVDMSVDIEAKPMEHELFEVALKLRVSAKHEDKPAFLLELVYAGLFVLHNIPEQIHNQILLIEAPHLLFPFARRIVADVVRDGGLPTLMIEPIDFAALYQARLEEMKKQQQAVSGSAAAPN
jgi:preprotein translocase subunit SecB